MAWPKNYKQYEGEPGQGSPNNWKEAFKERISPEEAEEIFSTSSQTPWQILQLCEGATLAEIKRNFKELILLWHPDRTAITNRTKEECETMSKKIIAAYTLLTNQKKK